MLEELRGLGFSWTKIGEMLGVSRWTIHRRVSSYGLENMTGFNDLSDAEIDEIVESFILNYGRTVGQDYVGGYIRSLGLRIQRRRIRESIARMDPQNTALRWGIPCTLAKFSLALRWPSLFDSLETCYPWMHRRIFETNYVSDLQFK